MLVLANGRASLHVLVSEPALVVATLTRQLQLRVLAVLLESLRRIEESRAGYESTPKSLQARRSNSIPSIAASVAPKTREPCTGTPDEWKLMMATLCTPGASANLMSECGMAF